MNGRAAAAYRWALGGWRAKVRVALGVLLAPWVALLAGALVARVPEPLAGARVPAPSVRVLDREGRVLREVRADDGARARWVPLGEVDPRFVRAMLAAEDQRFFQHPGIDPIAIVRAAAQMLVHRRVVSGASTITQQLARAVMKRPRTLGGKFVEMAVALRIEASLSKREILEQYVNRVYFGPGLRGVETASRYWFDKPTRDLSLAEAATLASIPRGPSLYDPRRGTGRLRRRRDRVLERLRASGAEPADSVARALAEPLAIAKHPGGFGAPHFVRGLLSGAIPSGLPAGARLSEVTTTIDARLEREVEQLARNTVRELAARDVSAAAVVVIDNATGDVLAYVGSPDFDDAKRLGQNDGVLAKRQPGSSLKPFLYELAIERLGFSPATVLPDVELHFPTGQGGDYRPNDYDGRFHGPVRLREALANSLNVPAVWTASQLGPDLVLERLRALGLGSLDASAETYGVAIALGDGEVRLLDLANAYATLARGGVWRPLRAVLAAKDAEGHALAATQGEARRVLDERATYVVTDVISDAKARLASFGEGSVLELPFAVAVKTGTSKGYRDNITVGYTPEVTVGVWVGNFDGAPMHGVSGVTGAGPLFRGAMMAASRLRPPHPFTRPDGIAEAEVCTLSGARPTALCPHRRREIFARASGEKGGPPDAPCAMHESVRIDRRTDLRAGPACPDAVVDERVFERFDPPFVAWARTAGRDVAPDADSPLCPGAPRPRPVEGTLRVAYPLDGARFAIDPGLAARQAIRVRADVPPGLAHVRFVLDGRAVDARPPFTLDVPLVAGAHRVQVVADGVAPSEAVDFEVE